MSGISTYYSFILAFTVLGLLPLYAMISWKNYWAEKEREKTLRQAMKQ